MSEAHRNRWMMNSLGCRKRSICSHFMHFPNCLVHCPWMRILCRSTNNIKTLSCASYHRKTQHSSCNRAFRHSIRTPNEEYLPSYYTYDTSFSVPVFPTAVLPVWIADTMPIVVRTHRSQNADVLDKINCIVRRLHRLLGLFQATSYHSMTFLPVVTGSTFVVTGSTLIVSPLLSPAISWMIVERTWWDFYKIFTSTSSNTWVFFSGWLVVLFFFSRNVVFLGV